jgi:hypothetical protein
MSKLTKIIKEVALEANKGVRKKKTKTFVELNPKAETLPPQR